MILDIFKLEAELTVEIEKIRNLLKERMIKIAELREQNEKTNHEINDISIEIERLLNQYYQMIFASKLNNNLYSQSFGESTVDKFIGADAFAVCSEKSEATRR